MSGQCPLQMPATYREPLCPLKVLPLTVSCLCTTSESVTSPSQLILAHAPDQKPSCRLGLNLVRQVFVDCCKSLLGSWPFPTLFLQSLRRCLDPYPAVSFWCICSLLPKRQRPHLRRQKFGTLKMPPIMQLQPGNFSRGCSHSLMFRLPRSLDPQVAPTAEA